MIESGRAGARTAEAAGHRSGDGSDQVPRRPARESGGRPGNVQSDQGVHSMADADHFDKLKQSKNNADFFEAMNT